MSTCGHFRQKCRKWPYYTPLFCTLCTIVTICTVISADFTNYLVIVTWGAHTISRAYAKSVKKRCIVRQCFADFGSNRLKSLKSPIPCLTIHLFLHNFARNLAQPVQKEVYSKAKIGAFRSNRSKPPIPCLTIHLFLHNLGQIWPKPVQNRCIVRQKSAVSRSSSKIAKTRKIMGTGMGVNRTTSQKHCFCSACAICTHPRTPLFCSSLAIFPKNR